MSPKMITVLCVVIFSTPFLAQPTVAAGRPGGGGAGRGGQARVMTGTGGGIQNRPQMLAAIKDQLDISDDDWDKLSPKIEKVLDAKRNLATGAGMSWSSQNGAPPVYKISDATPSTPAGKAMQDLRAALQDKDTPPDQITQKLAALKEAIDQARTDLAAAQKELNEALTPRQQAVLATLGVTE
jgi:hypothetical protein